MKFFFTGLISGIISGMGIGGGTILIPAITFLSDITQKQAQSINLICFLPTAAAALFIHAKNKNIETKILKPLLIFRYSRCIYGNALGQRNFKKSLWSFFIFNGCKGIFC